MNLRRILAPLVAITIASSSTIVAMPQAAADDSIHHISGEDPGKYLNQSTINKIVAYVKKDGFKTSGKGWESIQKSAVAVANFYGPALKDNEKLAILKVYFASTGSQWNKFVKLLGSKTFQKCNIGAPILGCGVWGDPKTEHRKITGTTVNKMYGSLPNDLKSELWNSVPKDVLKVRSEDGDKAGGWNKGPSPYQEWATQEGDNKDLSSQGSSSNDDDGQGALIVMLAIAGIGLSGIWGARGDLIRMYKATPNLPPLPPFIEAMVPAPPAPQPQTPARPAAPAPAQPPAVIYRDRVVYREQPAPVQPAPPVPSAPTRRDSTPPAPAPAPPRSVPVQPGLTTG